MRGARAGTDCRQRFDTNRRDLFHYLLYAHARGMPKSTDPASPDFHVPRSSSGISDLPGGDGMVTLGLWDNFVGTDFVQASTTMHELGHNTVAQPRRPSHGRAELQAELSSA